MNPPNRSADIIDHLEAVAAADGHFEPVDEYYYQAFVDLSQPRIEKLATALMLLWLLSREISQTQLPL